MQPVLIAKFQAKVILTVVPFEGPNVKKSQWFQNKNVIIIHKTAFPEGFVSLDLGKVMIGKATSLYSSILEDKD